MAHKKVCFRSEAREKVLRGSTAPVDAVSATLEESRTADPTFDFVEGMQFDQGDISPYSVTGGDKMVPVPKNAAGVASVLLLTEATGTEVPGKRKGPPRSSPRWNDRL